MSNLAFDERYTFCEVFAWTLGLYGLPACQVMVGAPEYKYMPPRKDNGHTVASYDRLYDNKSMDFVSSAGFGFLSCIINSPYALQCLLHSWPVGSMYLRLALYAVLCQVPDAMNLIAPDCGSWVTTSRGSSLRSFINPLGRQGLQWVDDNNCTVSRSIDCI